MAEIFGAVASGAGLMSLAMQLLESSQKLKSFYNASKDAPQTISDLSFELETMSLSLRQLVIHRQADISSDVLLGRCMMTCTLMTAKIEAAVDKMEHLLRKSRGIGRMYSAFKEPEISKLLEGLEHAKSSMLFGYMSYCQSWNLRQASLRAAEAQAQSVLLSSHEAQLQDLSLAVQSGHATILKKIETSRPSGPVTSCGSASAIRHTGRGLAQRDHTKRSSARTFRFALPRWLSHHVWEFAAHELDGAWNFRVRPVNIRPRGTFAFEVVRSGNVEAVKKLLMSGELSVSDHEHDRYKARHRSLLFVAAEVGRLELCEFLLHEFPNYHSETDLHSILNGFVHRHLNHRIDEHEKRTLRELIKAFYKLFLRMYGISVDLHELIEKPIVEFGRDLMPPYHRPEDVASNPLLTDEALQEIIMSQTIPFKEWHPTDRFCAAVNARGWPAGAFVKLIGAESNVQLAQWTDRRGKTALHWAAEHLGCWTSNSVAPAFYIENDDLERQYSELCTMLITNGADPNALDSENRTPFTCFLRAMQTTNDPWYDHTLGRAISQWGQVLQDAGVSLSAYVRAENSLQSKFPSAATNLRIWSKGNPWSCRLLISEALTLAIEVGFPVPRPLWQYSPPPGAWAKEGYQLEKIGWSPNYYFEGDDYDLWQQAEDSSIKLQPELICTYETSFRENAADAWREWASGVQDDHGFVCMTLQELPEVSKRRGRMRRAASLPPPTTVLDENPCEPDGHCFVFRYAARSWVSNPHKCPLDLTWKSTYRSTEEVWDSRRRCMQGRCNDGELDLLGVRHWEVQLLDNKGNIEIARRFTDRFRPEWRHVLEENHRRAQRRAELGMFPT